MNPVALLVVIAVLGFIVVGVAAVLYGTVDRKPLSGTEFYTDRPPASFEEMVEQQKMAEALRPIMEMLYKEAFEHGYVYALRGEVRAPTAEERERWSYSLPPEASAPDLRAVA
ncbi:hypothetical protein AWB92_26710 [Mycobacterium sp. IEC1808]|uniref:hypothetical protein n=1 Tax=Mycobacterium sp. IEC1808 TaxID=1743230 RepID=UPI000A14783E|nr:hypothetical protein [Mycobacterium sp. IEC1808]ORW85971.1 hypothetical protein AWB92_26710 [Mycobacterium sp. IEC1808]